MGLLTMSEKERHYKAIFEMVKQGKITLVHAAESAEISYRQGKRLYQRYKKEGDKGLIHRSRGRVSNHQLANREMIIQRYCERYRGFGPTLAAEKLYEEDQLLVDHETLRRWLIAEKLWHRERKRGPHRKRRESRAQFGELVQMDGSIHDWLQNGENNCLLNMVDDATGITLAYLDSGETTRVVFQVLKEWIERYGIPLALYVDLKSVYVSKKLMNFSHVERACQKLGIRIIKAYSPQAKGRVERNHGVYQDRFVKELQLLKVKTIVEANGVLKNGFIDKLNRKFAKVAHNPISAHRSAEGINLNAALCWEYTRTIQNDWTVSFRKKIYQIEKPYGCAVKVRSQVLIRCDLNNELTVWYDEEQLCIKEISQRQLAQKQELTHTAKLNSHKPISQRESWKVTNALLYLKKVS